MFDKATYWATKNTKKQLRLDLADTKPDPKTKQPVPTDKAKKAQAELSKLYVAEKGIVGFTPSFAVKQGAPNSRKARRAAETKRGHKRRNGEKS